MAAHGGPCRPDRPGPDRFNFIAVDYLAYTNEVIGAGARR
jgi:hypothetical protein